MTRSIRRSWSTSLLAMAMAGGAIVLSSAAQAQAPKPAQQPPKPAAGAPAAAAAAGPTVVNLKADPTQAWVKVCGEDQAAKKTVCYTTRDFVAPESNQPILAAAIYDVQNDPKKFVRLLMPLTFMLQPGIRMSIDGGQPIAGRFQICFPNGCFAEAEVTEAIINAMKKGANLKIDAQNQLGREVSFMMPLEGFGKSFDGAPIDPKVLEEQRSKLEAELQKQAEEMRKQQGGTAAPAAPATPAAPKP